MSMPNLFNHTIKQAVITVLSMGLGQDSVTILLKLIFDKAFRKKYAPGRLMVLFSNTGNEHPETYKYRNEVIIPLCKEFNIEFISIEPSMGFHGNNWSSLTEQWKGGDRATIGSVAYPKSCTHQLKLAPQYNYMEKFLSDTYSFNHGRKASFKAFAQEYGKISWLIGIAKGEEKRVNNAEIKEKWRKMSIQTEYPLIDIGYTRQSCQDYIKECNYPIPMPSNCMFCPFGCNEKEILWMYYSYPDKFDEWVELEQSKLDDWSHKDKNLGVNGKLHKNGERKGQAVTLRDILNTALANNPDITLDELNEYKWSHGHCVASKY